LNRSRHLIITIDLDEIVAPGIDRDIPFVDFGDLHENTNSNARAITFDLAQ